MASSNVRTSSEALTNLQTDLSTLSEDLHQTYNLMYDYMLKVGEFWQDRKYEEFVEDYQPKIEKCDEIATRYEDWCKKVLQPAIDRAHEAEDVNVGLDGGVNSTTGTPPDTPQNQNPSPNENSTDPHQNTQPQQPNNPPTIEENPVVGNEEEMGLKPVEEMTTEELLKELTPEQRAAYENLKKQYTDEYNQGLADAEAGEGAITIAQALSGAPFIGVSESASTIAKGAEKMKYDQKMAQLNEDLKLGVLHNRAEKSNSTHVEDMSMDEVLSHLSKNQEDDYYREKKEIENSKITAFYSDRQRQKDLLELDEKTKDILRDERAKNYKQIWENPSSDPVNYAGYRAFGKNGIHISDCEIVTSTEEGKPWNVKYGKGVSTEHSQEITDNISGGAELGGAKLTGSYNESQGVGMIKKQSAKTTGFCKPIENPEDYKYVSVGDLTIQQAEDELTDEKKGIANAWKHEIEQKKEERYRALYNPHRKFAPNKSEIDFMNKLNERDEKEYENAIRRGVRTQRSKGIFPKPESPSAADEKAEEQSKKIPGKNHVADINPKCNSNVDGKLTGCSYSSELSDEEIKWHEWRHQEQSSGGVNFVYSIGASKSQSNTRKEVNAFDVEARFNIKEIDETHNGSME